VDKIQPVGGFPGQGLGGIAAKNVNLFGLKGRKTLYGCKGTYFTLLASPKIAAAMARPVSISNTIGDIIS
jgi:hypothetical protein